MVFRRSNKRRRTSRRRVVRGSRRSYKRVARRVTRASLPVEFKAIDGGTDDVEFSTSPLYLEMSLIERGTDIDERVGRSVSLLSLRIQGTIRPKAVSSSQLCRIILVWDKNPNGAVASWQTMFTSATSYTFSNLDNRRRFTILRDWKYVFGQSDMTTANGTFITTPSAYKIDEYINLKGLKTIYNITVAAETGAVETGALMLWKIGSVDAGTTSALLDYKYRLRYVG